ncbi:Rrf2 family transcriptional regulator [Bengtsoniella intestinalis]|uniref:RrF2 family transcriptional regulator n=1 Tax=Bengtsoniella intestinalis TaxID=3073143 RepID=UPI00391F0D6F
MMISTKGRYALRVMVDIATYSNGQYLSLRDVAERQEISMKYLESIVAALCRQELLESLRGKLGGYRLSKPLEDYTLGQILKATEGTMAPVACLAEPGACKNGEHCPSLPVWQELDRIIDEYLESVSLVSVLERGGAGMCDLKKG